MQSLKIIKWVNIVLNCILMIIGVLFVCLNDVIANILPYLCGIILIFLGVAKIVEFAFSFKYFNYEYLTIIKGIILFAIGLLFIIVPKSTQAMISIIIGIKLLIEGVDNTKVMVLKRKLGEDPLVDFIVAMIDLAIAIVVLLNLNSTIRVCIIFAGVGLIIDALSYLVNMFVLSNEITKIEKFTDIE